MTPISQRESSLFPSRAHWPAHQGKTPSRAGSRVSSVAEGKGRRIAPGVSVSCEQLPLPVHWNSLMSPL